MEQKKSVFKGRYWMLMGVLISLLASCIFTGFYGVFRESVENFRTSPIETGNNLTVLYQYSYVLYKDLYNKIHNTDLDYSSLYLQPEEGSEWINDETIYPYVEEGEYHEVAEGYENGEAAESAISQLLEGREYLEQHFTEMEQNFEYLNLYYDYLAEDLETGEILTNLASAEIDSEKQYFQLGFLFDEKGNVSMDSIVRGNDVTRLRKYANEVIHNCSLENLVQSGTRASSGSASALYQLSMPKNFKITFCIAADDWQQMQENGDYGYAVISGGYSGYWDYYEAYRLAGCLNLFGQIGAAVFLCAIFLPLPGKERPWERKLCRIPLEAVLILACMFFSFTDILCEFVPYIAEGKFTKTFSAYLSVQGAYLLAYGLNLLFLTLMFCFLWYLGACVRAVRYLGPVSYVRERSLIYRFFPFIKGKLHEVNEAIKHFDVTKNAKRLIVKIVVVNAVILFIISSLWVVGFWVAIVYSVVLYFVLRKYISDIQKRYSLLLGYINQIAEGNLNGNMTEDLGVFNPLKPQLIRIQRGFKKAVEEEVKSQKMKSELITNVSHDLKTPLTAIITYVDLLKNENLTEEQRKEYLATLERKSLRLKVLIEDLFEVSKASTGNVTLNIVQVDIMNLVKQVAVELSDKLSAAGLDMRISLSDEKVLLPLDSQKTYRIYENLIGNIAKYAMPGTRVYVDGACTDDRVVITLKNITAQEIKTSPEELMERFQRGDASRNTEGSGLGLAIAKSFMELQNGSLEVSVDGDLFKVTTIFKITESKITE